MSAASLTGAAGPPATAAAQRPSRLRELVPALAGAAVAVAVLVLVAQVPADGPTRFSPRWWPEGLAFGLLGLSALHAALCLRRPAAPDAPEPATRAGALRLASMLLAILGYGVLWYFVDFRVSTTVLVAALTFLAGGRGWKALLAFPVICTMVLYLLFGVLLRVPI